MLRINHAILHVFDFTSCVNVFSQGELDLESRDSRQVKNYVTKQVKKALGNIDNKHGQFVPESLFVPELQAYFAGQRDFIDLSRQIGEFIAGELGRMSKSESTDLLVVDFEEAEQLEGGSHDDDAIEASFSGRVNRYFGIFLLESRQAFMHAVGYGEGDVPINNIERHHAILPNPSQKIASFALINMRTMDVVFQDKKRVIAGEDTWLIPDKLLQCTMEASSKEVIGELSRIVEEVAAEYGADPVVSLSKAKAYVCESTEENEEVAPFDMAQEVFDDEPLRQRFMSQVAEEEIPERVRVEKKAAERVGRNHKIRTDTGIEITFPSEYANNSDFIEFASTPNGLISIELKNIGHIENKR
ncbi:MAG: nucleoid-associated protein [Eggerthellaceae bacterium]